MDYLSVMMSKEWLLFWFVVAVVIMMCWHVERARNKTDTGGAPLKY
jgi:hypothetical protein